MRGVPRRTRHPGLDQGQGQRDAAAGHDHDGHLPDPDPGARPRGPAAHERDLPALPRRRRRSCANGGPVKLVLQERFRQDEPNTRDTIALVLRPTGFGGTSATRGVHWHVDRRSTISRPTRAPRRSTTCRSTRTTARSRSSSPRSAGLAPDQRPARHRAPEDRRDAPAHGLHRLPQPGGPWSTDARPGHRRRHLDAGHRPQPAVHQEGGQREAGGQLPQRR